MQQASVELPEGAFDSSDRETKGMSPRNSSSISGQSNKRKLQDRSRPNTKRPEQSVRRYPVLIDRACCREKIDELKITLEPALLTDKERAQKAKTKNTSSVASSSTLATSSLETPGSPCEYNRARLHQGLVQHAFDVYGNCIVHQCCLADELHIGDWSIMSAHKRAKAKAEPCHGLVGKAGNNSKKLEQQAFIAWVKSVRNPASSVQGAEISSGAA